MLVGGCWFRVLGFVVTLDSILGVGLSLVCGYEFADGLGCVLWVFGVCCLYAVGFGWCVFLCWWLCIVF